MTTGMFEFMTAAMAIAVAIGVAVGSAVAGVLDAREQHAAPEDQAIEAAKGIVAGGFVGAVIGALWFVVVPVALAGVGLYGIGMLFVWLVPGRPR